MRFYLPSARLIYESSLQATNSFDFTMTLNRQLNDFYIPSEVVLQLWNLLNQSSPHHSVPHVHRKRRGWFSPETLARSTNSAQFVYLAHWTNNFFDAHAANTIFPRSVRVCHKRINQSIFHCKIRTSVSSTFLDPFHFSPLHLHRPIIFWSLFPQWDTQIYICRFL